MSDDINSIPLVDLKAQYKTIRKEIDIALADCVAATDFIKGKKVTEFERSYAEYIGADYCIGCGNGTDALELILESLGIGRGDEVIVPALTWIATAEAVSNVGAEPVFADVLEDDYTIDPARIASSITSRTKAIIVVHLYGLPCRMDDLMELASTNNLHIVEDCAQSHGAVYNGRKIGTFGIASAFSFFPSKNLGAFGDAGAIVTSDPEIAEKARMIANHGQYSKRHDHRIIGRNSRLDTLQAAVLLVKLPHLDKWNELRIAAAGKYAEILSSSSAIRLPDTNIKSGHVFHLFVIRTPMRDYVIKCLDTDNIGWGIHYPAAVPLLDAYKYKDHKSSDFPVAHAASQSVLSLPLFPEISHQQIERVCAAVLRAFK